MVAEAVDQREIDSVPQRLNLDTLGDLGSYRRWFGLWKSVLLLGPGIWKCISGGRFGKTWRTGTRVYVGNIKVGGMSEPSSSLALDELSPFIGKKRCL